MKRDLIAQRGMEKMRHQWYEANRKIDSVKSQLEEIAHQLNFERRFTPLHFFQSLVCPGQPRDDVLVPYQQIRSLLLGAIETLEPEAGDRHTDHIDQAYIDQQLLRPMREHVERMQTFAEDYTIADFVMAPRRGGEHQNLADVRRRLRRYLAQALQRWVPSARQFREAAASFRSAEEENLLQRGGSAVSGGFGTSLMGEKFGLEPSPVSSVDEERDGTGKFAGPTTTPVEGGAADKQQREFEGRDFYFQNLERPRNTSRAGSLAPGSNSQKQGRGQHNSFDARASVMAHAVLFSTGQLKKSSAHFDVEYLPEILESPAVRARQPRVANFLDLWQLKMDEKILFVQFLIEQRVKPKMEEFLKLQTE